MRAENSASCVPFKIKIWGWGCSALITALWRETVEQVKGLNKTTSHKEFYSSQFCNKELFKQQQQQHSYQQLHLKHTHTHTRKCKQNTLKESFQGYFVSRRFTSHCVVMQYIMLKRHLHSKFGRLSLLSMDPVHLYSLENYPASQIVYSVVPTQREISSLYIQERLSVF